MPTIFCKISNPVLKNNFQRRITIKSNNNDALKLAIVQGMSAMLAAVDNAGAATSKAAPKAKGTRKADSMEKKKHLGRYRVEDYRALYCLADADLLDKISDVRQSTKYPGTRLYFVDKTPETKAALAAFLTQKELAEDVSTD